MKDLIGMRFGKLVVKSFSHKKNSRNHWNCTCDCGKEIIVRDDSLITGNTKSCRTCPKDIVQKMIGKIYGKLTVLEYIGKIKGHYQFLCKCSCGNTHKVSGENLRNGSVKSCGCLPSPLQTHGLYNKNRRLNAIFQAMKARCNNPKNPSYKHYGARGIKICNEWQNYKNFYDWAMSNGYNDNLTIDRIDVNGNYEPTNCHWATDIQQARNTRRNHFVIINGEKRTLAEWIEICGIKPGTVTKRIYVDKWDCIKALTKPTRKNKTMKSVNTI